MNVLEKILEEIEEYEKRKCSGESLSAFESGIGRGCLEAKEIIRSHMDHSGDDTEMDGWIPVEERLPNESEFQEAYCRNHYAAEFLVTIKGATRPTTLYFTNNSWFDEEMNYYKVAAWQPLPEPYKEEQDNAKDV